MRPPVNRNSGALAHLGQQCQEIFSRLVRRPSWLRGSLGLCDGPSLPFANASHSSSLITLTPNSLALSSFEPAPGPATTRSVFFETEPATLAPSRSAMALASSRVIFSKDPVNTTDLPAT